jgi:hypothetical protein
MSEITTTAIYNDLQQNLPSEMSNLPSDTNETSLSSTEIANPMTNSTDIDEPPTKKCKITSNDKPRLLEDRIGSILSCCICLDLSTLPIFQVKLSKKFLLKEEKIFFLVC